jgi:hypothetical protein
VPLEPESRLIFAFETDADPEQWTRPEVSALALDEDGEPLRVEIAVDTSVLALDVVADESFPGFGDALSSAWDLLQRIFGIAVIVAGFLVPFLWVPVIAVATWYLLRRRSRTPAEAPAVGDDEV